MVFVGKEMKSLGCMWCRVHYESHFINDWLWRPLPIDETLHNNDDLKLVELDLYMSRPSRI